ncbi:uncharacterized protein LOC125334689 [Corvus hawaiiensis]|uniref:uncharacterized protein LOC125334689 n=1 Tax=Corvus hawaiiensis TaxID=134902 RepID=UPI0020194FE5|nr:uncharacterized protein LOC125334689 [Corvus hawaiiensis]
MHLAYLILTVFLGQLLVAVARAQVQQEPRLETTENTGINISCSHPKIQTGDWIQWYRQLPGRGPELLALTVKESKELPDIAGGLWVSADRRSSALWLRRPRRGDAAVYYCALGDTGRGAGAAAGHEPPRAGPATNTDFCTGINTDTGRDTGTITDTSTDTHTGSSNLESPTALSPSSQRWLCAAEFLILSATSFWHCGTVCNCLVKNTIMTKEDSCLPVLLAWAAGSADISFQVSVLLKCPFCTKNIADHFFCDAAPS